MNTNSLKTASHRNVVNLNGVLSSIAIVFSYLVFASIASAANYYATATGSGTSCTQSAPCSLTTAVTKPVAGDTVHVAPGTYSYTSTAYQAIKTSKSGTASARIRYVSDTKWGAKIVSKGTWAVWRNDGDYVDIEGFDITGDGAGGIYNFGSFNRIIGNHVHNIAGPPDCANDSNGGAGIENAEYTASDNEIIGNVVHDVGIVNCGMDNHRVHGIYHSNLRGHIYNNISYHNTGFGIHTWHAAKAVVITNNLVFRNGAGGIIVGAGDSPGGVTADGFIVNNNIVYDNLGVSIIEEGTYGVNTYSNNCVYNNGTGTGNNNTYLYVGSKSIISGTVVKDPLFVNYKADGTGDYHLSANSPAIGAGTTQGAPRDDFDGLIRMGSTYIGPLILVPPSNLHVNLQ